MPPQVFLSPANECNDVKSVRQIPRSHDWQYEIKFDGYRCIAIKQRNEVQFYSRRGMLFEKFLFWPKIVVGAAGLETI
jgi:ATP-dependent DNA ligase